MLVVNLRVSHSLPLPRVRLRLTELMDKLQSQANARASWSTEDRFVVRGPGIDGSVTWNAQEIVLELRLGVMMSVIAEAIRDELRWELNRIAEGL